MFSLWSSRPGGRQHGSTVDVSSVLGDGPCMWADDLANNGMLYYYFGEIGECLALHDDYSEVLGKGRDLFGC